MMLPTILDEMPDGDSCTLQLRVPVELDCLPGHFPGTPVVPGVVQVGWVLALAAPRLGCSAVCREMEALKFQRLLQPGDAVTLTLRLDRARGKLHFAYRIGETGGSSGRLVLEGAA